MSDTDHATMIANMAAAARNVFGHDVPIETTATGVVFPMGIFGGSEKKRMERPGTHLIEKYLKDDAAGDAFLARGMAGMSLDVSVRANVLRGRADRLVKAGEYAKAVKLYIEGAETLCKATLPVRRARSKIYMDLDISWDGHDVMACLSNAASALMKAKDYSQALLWLGEALDVARNMRFVGLKDRPAFDWFDIHVGMTQHFLQVFKTFDVLADVYLKVGNTGANVYYRWQAQVTLSNVPKEFQTAELNRLLRECNKKLEQTSSYRHPEPSLVAKLEVVDGKSHVHGSWRKIEPKHPGGLTQRMGGGVFIYQGFLYIAGGEKFQSGPYFREFWRLDLTKMGKWDALPPIPIPVNRIESLTGFRMVVGPDDKAYYFTGSLTLLTFDLRTLRWDTLKTTFDGSWQYPWRALNDRWKGAVMHCVGERLYVFSGHHAASKLGCDLLLELDLTTRVWRKLSGTLTAKEPSSLLPGPRINACSWVGKDKNKIFVMYGDADRMGAELGGEAEHGAMTSYGYDDLWSWDIHAGKWTREKIVGNAPSPRTEMSAVYNPVLDKVITFGGYSPSAPTVHLQNDEIFRFSYYADTFICDFQQPLPATLDRQAPASSSSKIASVNSFPLKWRQVLTRGFPTYRAQAHLLADPATGKTYLFSGYVNTEFVPSRSKSFSRSFADLWELRLDIPGGNFEGVDLEEEARTARAGPWQRCFACGSAGPWKKCGGSCHGRAFFCSPQCLKDGWKEHKLNHRCSKIA